MVVANILSSPLKLMAPMLSGRVAPGGRLVLSGVLARQADEVIAAYAPHMALASGPSAKAGWRWQARRPAQAASGNGMVLATRCPHCRTTFRVVQDQLKLRGGLVRCGACKEIFNGTENLLRPIDAAAGNPRPPAADATCHRAAGRGQRAGSGRTAGDWRCPGIFIFTVT